MQRFILLLNVFVFSFSILGAQVVVFEKEAFDLGEISLLNEDVIDLTIENTTDERLFMLRITSEDHVRIKFTSRTIQPGEAEMLRVKLNPHKKGSYKTEVEVFFAQNTEPIELTFTADVIEVPVNQLQACPDFSSSRKAVITPGAYRKQAKGEIREEQVAVMRQEDLEDYLLAKQQAALAYKQEQEDQGEVNEQEEIEVESFEDIKYAYQQKTNEPLLEESEKELPEEEPEEKKKSEETSGNLLDESYKPNNIVFLLDASTSMSKDGKMELLKSSMKELLVPLRSIDQIAIVSYAGDAELLMASTEASDKGKISDMIDNIPAEGYTNAVKGLRMALQVARKNFIEGGNNQIILATDGAFDIGSKNDRLRRKISASAKDQIIVSVIGIKNDRWTNKSLKEIADLGGGELLRIHSNRNLAVILEEVKSRSLK